MQETHDIAGTLFTSQYRLQKILGVHKPHNLQSTNSCFENSNDKLSNKRAGGHYLLHVGGNELPYWSKALLAYKSVSLCASASPKVANSSAVPTHRMPMGKPDTHLYLRKGSGVLVREAHGNPLPLRPPKAGAIRRRDNPPNTAFRRFYERGDLPVAVEHRGMKNVIRWKTEVAKLDYHHYLPIFFDGCRETQEPYRFLAVKGVEDMLKAGGAKILPVIPQLVIPTKTALNTRDPQVISIMLQLLQKLVLSGDRIGEALVPYYRQLLPIFNLYKNSNKNLGDGIDYGQRQFSCLGDLISDTLALFEQKGGEDAFVNIRYMVPTYESCMQG